MVISSLCGCGKSEDNAEIQENNTEVIEDSDFKEEKDDSTENEINTESETSIENETEEIISENTDEKISDEVVGDFRTEPNTPEELAYAAYEKYLMDGSYGSITSYEFVYIDDDDIPELVMVPSNGCLALSYHDGEVIQLCYSSATFFGYVERQGYYYYGGMYKEDNYGMLSEGETKIVAYYEPILDNTTYTGENRYYIGNMENGEEVSKDKYDSYIKSLGDFNNMLEGGVKWTNMYDAYKAFKGISDDAANSDDEAWKEAYINSYEFQDDEYTHYYVINPNQDNIPEVIMEDVDGGREVYYLDKFNKLNSLGYGNPIYEGGGGSIYIVSGAFQQIANRTITEYMYYDETGSWSSANQFEIILDTDWNSRIPGDYDYSDNNLYKDSAYCSYKVNGKDYSSYDEAANEFSQEYASGDIQEINAYENNYKLYNYSSFRQAILDYGFEIYEPLMYQVMKFEFANGKLNVVADTAPKLENEYLQPFEISYPIGIDCKWYEAFECSVEGLTTYENICESQQKRRNDYETLDKTSLTMGEATSQLIIKVKNGVIVEIYLNSVL